MDRPWADWGDVARLVEQRPPRDDLHVPKGAVPHPKTAGMRRHIGVPYGTLHHFRKPLRGRTGLHVKEFREHYRVHWDEVDPLRFPLRHLWVDVRGGKAFTAVVGIAVAALPFAVL